MLLSGGLYQEGQYIFNQFVDLFIAEPKSNCFNKMGPFISEGFDIEANMVQGSAGLNLFNMLYSQFLNKNYA